MNPSVESKEKALNDAIELAYAVLSAPDGNRIYDPESINTFISSVYKSLSNLYEEASIPPAPHVTHPAPAPAPRYVPPAPPVPNVSK